MEKKVVLDFDRTIIKFDSINGFYRRATTSALEYWIKCIPYFFIQVAYKGGLISNGKLKRFGFKLFIKGRNMGFLETIALDYAKYLEGTIDRNLLSSFIDDDCVIISGSYHIYLKHIAFPLKKFRVIGSAIEEVNNKAIKVSNVFGRRKLSIIRNDIKWEFFDVAVTDSLTDISLLDAALTGYLIDKQRNLVKYANSDV